MAWWSSYRDVGMVFVVICDDVRQNAAGAYQDAGRRIRCGQYESYRSMKFSVLIHVLSDIGVWPTLPGMDWRTLPPNLAELLVRTESPPMEVFSMKSHLERDRGYRRMPTSGLFVPPQPLPSFVTLGSEWDQLFPGDALNEGLLLREHLRKTFAIRQSNPAGYRDAVLQRTSELTQDVTCPNELPIWDILAAENEEDTLSLVEERFGVKGADWGTVRSSKAFLQATARRTGAVIVWGLQGLIWLQLAGSLPQDTGYRDCAEPGCTSPVPQGRRKRCEEHSRENARRTSARLSQENRARAKPTR